MKTLDFEREATAFLELHGINEKDTVDYAKMKHLLVGLSSLLFDETRDKINMGHLRGREEGHILGYNKAVQDWKRTGILVKKFRK